MVAYSSINGSLIRCTRMRLAILYAFLAFLDTKLHILFSANSIRMKRGIDIEGLLISRRWLTHFWIYITVANVHSTASEWEKPFYNEFLGCSRIVGKVSAKESTFMWME
jgi:hypothetical protein